MVGVLSNKISRDELKPGDHIYTWRRLYVYTHHGIYVGDGNVISFTSGTGTAFSSSSSSTLGSPCPRCGYQSGADGVISSCLECFLSDGELYLFRYGVSPAFFLAQACGGTCTLAHSDPPEDVLHRAKYLLENGFRRYSLFGNNCGDFAVYCKTELIIPMPIGIGGSGQAAGYVAGAFAAGLAGTGLGFGIYCITRIAFDIGVRPDAIKVPVERLC